MPISLDNSFFLNPSSSMLFCWLTGNISSTDTLKLNRFLGLSTYILPHIFFSLFIILLVLSMFLADIFFGFQIQFLKILLFFFLFPLIFMPAFRPGCFSFKRKILFQIQNTFTSLNMTYVFLIKNSYVIIYVFVHFY